VPLIRRALQPHLRFIAPRREAVTEFVKRSQRYLTIGIAAFGRRFE
jgi:hypothetical protein